jgi:hypothetical protein
MKKYPAPGIIILLLLMCVCQSEKCGKPELFLLLTPYDVQDVSSTMERYGRDFDGGYVVPSSVLKTARALLSYGVADDVSFEMDVIKTFNIDVYAFDCGVHDVPEKNPRLHFYSECIGSDKYLYSSQESSLKFATYAEQVKKLGLLNKKIIIKMDVEGAEYEAFENIPRHFWDTIQAIIIELHGLNKWNSRNKAVKLLKLFNENLTLVHLHANNFDRIFRFNGSIFPAVLELTYVNNSLVKKRTVSNKQYNASLDRPNNKNAPDIALDFWR